MECEYLFCHERATVRLTVPHVKPRAAFCQKHADELLEHAKAYRKVPGMVSIEPVERLPA